MGPQERNRPVSTNGNVVHESHRSCDRRDVDRLSKSQVEVEYQRRRSVERDYTERRRVEPESDVCGGESVYREVEPY